MTTKTSHLVTFTVAVSSKTVIRNPMQSCRPEWTTEGCIQGMSNRVPWLSFDFLYQHQLSCSTSLSLSQHKNWFMFSPKRLRSCHLCPWKEKKTWPPDGTHAATRRLGKVEPHDKWCDFCCFSFNGKASPVSTTTVIPSTKLTSLCSSIPKPLERGIRKGEGKQKKVCGRLHEPSSGGHRCTRKQSKSSTSCK